MTHSEPTEQAGIVSSAGELCTALIRLDYGAVEGRCSDLEDRMSLLRNGSVRLSAPEADKLRKDLLRARTLVENADRLYAGWARVAALDGGGYTCSGTRPLIAAASSLVVQG